VGDGEFESFSHHQIIPPRRLHPVCPSGKHFFPFLKPICRRFTHNQAAQGKALRIWKNLYFRSQSEIRIAEALDRASVMFFPNCRGRLGLLASRENKEADFLVCHSGKWGILEVDGEPFHPPTLTAQDHARDRAFREHGIRLVEHFDATECYEKAGEVVARFLRLLERT
jgi:hypothetical protein